jgi:hypothetical protein
MSIAFPVFPTLIAGQSFITPNQPLRGVGWSVKKTPTWSNERQQTTSGRTLVVKYWVNPLWKWEFSYEIILDNPDNSNSFYSTPFPATDFEMLQGFYCGMEGMGNEFAYQPPDSIRGGSFTITSVYIGTANIAVLGINSSLSVGQLRLGDGLHISGLSVVTGLNGGNGTVIGLDTVANKITLSITIATHVFTADSGTAVGGQPLSVPDGDGNIEIVNTIGAYPNTLVAAPAINTSVESVQLPDTSTIIIYSNGTDVTSSCTFAAANTIADYQGVVAQFGVTSLTAPITASFQYFYLCRFSEDTQEFENFMAMLWKATVKIDQVRI